MTDRSGCAGTRRLLPELAAGAATAEERAAALRHLAGCGQCHRELEAHTALVDELVVAPAGLTATGFHRADTPTRDLAVGYLNDGRTNVLHLPAVGAGDGGTR